MPFDAIVLEEREKALKVAHLPKYGLDSIYAIFWIPKKTIYNREGQGETKSGKTITRIYYRSWAGELIWKAYRTGILRRLQTNSDSVLNNLSHKEFSDLEALEYLEDRYEIGYCNDCNKFYDLEKERHGDCGLRWR